MNPLSLKPNKNRAFYAIVFIWIEMVLDTVSILWDYQEREAWLNTGSLDSDFEELLFYFSLLYTVISIISVVTFILWFRRAYYNLHTQTDGLRYKEYFAALWWFIPFLNLYKPKHIMNELYSQTEDVIREKDPGYSQLIL
jgi:heme/copper-type cytochrome/quinol oxidase subunit 2